MENIESLVAELKEGHQKAVEGGRKALRAWGIANNGKLKKLIKLSPGKNPGELGKMVGCSVTVFKNRIKKKKASKKPAPTTTLSEKASEVLDLGLLFPDPKFRQGVVDFIRSIAILVRERDDATKRCSGFKKMLEKMISSVSISPSENSLVER